jgi:hypothetical protein
LDYFDPLNALAEQEKLWETIETAVSEYKKGLRVRLMQCIILTQMKKEKGEEDV